MGSLRQLFEKRPLNCDYIFGILSDSFGLLDYEKHISILVRRQERLDSDMGAWSEFISFPKGNEAPLATAETILALASFAGKAEVKSALKRACRFLIQSQHGDGGWDDLSGEHPVNDATGCVIAALSKAQKLNISVVPTKTLENGVSFLLSQQNSDGGWGTVKDEESKMHYTYFALMGLSCCKGMISNAVKEKVKKAIENGVEWINNNSHKNDDEGIGLSQESASSPVATALAIMSLSETGRTKLIKAKWIDFIKKTRKNGGWEDVSDSSMVHGVRRTYDFRGIPWIVEVLVRNGEPLDSDVVAGGLRELKKYELATGGFVRDIGDTNPVVWFTAWSIRLMHILRRELSNNLKMYVDNSIKKSAELKRKVENYERETRLEKNLISFFALSYTILVFVVTYLLFLVTSSLHGKLFWYSFLVISLFVLEITTAYYWFKRGKLNTFRGFILALASTAIGIFFGLVG